MTPHDLFFIRFEAPGLVENGQGDAPLADIVQRCREPQAPDIVWAKLDFERKTNGHSGHQQAVLERSFVMAANVVKPHAQSSLLDTADDLRCGVLGILGIRDRKRLARAYCR